jgi:acetyl-CoA carboxylase biotin carboxyl carrier protein
MIDRDQQGPLTDAEVDQVSRLIESLDRSGFDYLQVEVGAMTITIGTGEPPGRPAPAAAPAPAVAAPVVVPAPAVRPVPAAATSSATSSATSTEPAPVPVPTAGSLEIAAPTMGIFYSRPEPGKPPFVAVGDPVEETTTVALVEVMKTFHAVAAGVRGTVREICVSDTDFVELGQVLMRVGPGDAR